MTFRLYELLALSILALAVIAATLTALHLGADGEGASIAIGGFISALPIIVNAIRNIGQSQAMQTMADHLAKSRPSDPDDIP